MNGDITTIEKTETSLKFWQRMKRSMVNSFHKYGAVAQAYPHKVKAIASLKKRLDLYEQTGNADYLIDVANFAMIEFMRPAHAQFHDKPTDGGEGRYWQSGGATEKRNDGHRI